MASFTRPVDSSIAGIDFGVLSNEEIKAVSVKRIYNTPSLDSFNNPVPGGLYDTALGAWGDHMYAKLSFELSFSLVGIASIDEFYIQLLDMSIEFLVLRRPPWPYRIAGSSL